MNLITSIGNNPNFTTFPCHGPMNSSNLKYQPANLVMLSMHHSTDHTLHPNPAHQFLHYYKTGNLTAMSTTLPPSSPLNVIWASFQTTPSFKTITSPYTPLATDAALASLTIPYDTIPQGVTVPLCHLAFAFNNTMAASPMLTSSSSGAAMSQSPTTTRPGYILWYALL